MEIRKSWYNTNVLYLMMAILCLLFPSSLSHRASAGRTLLSDDMDNDTFGPIMQYSRGEYGFPLVKERNGVLIMTSDVPDISFKYINLDDTSRLFNDEYFMHIEWTVEVDPEKEHNLQLKNPDSNTIFKDEYYIQHNLQIGEDNQPSLSTKIDILTENQLRNNIFEAIYIEPPNVNHFSGTFILKIVSRIHDLNESEESPIKESSNEYTIYLPSYKGTNIDDDRSVHPILPIIPQECITSSQCSGVPGGAFCDIGTRQCYCNDNIIPFDRISRPHCRAKCPCLHGGSCLYPEDDQTSNTSQNLSIYGHALDNLNYKCQCIDGYTGPLCQVPPLDQLEQCDFEEYKPKQCFMGTLQCDNDKPICNCSDGWATMPNDQNECSVCLKISTEEHVDDDNNNANWTCYDQGTHQVSFTRERCNLKHCLCKKGWGGKRCQNRIIYGAVTFEIDEEESLEYNPRDLLKMNIDDYSNQVTRSIQSTFFSHLPNEIQLDIEQSNSMMNIYTTSNRKPINSDKSSNTGLLKSHSATFLIDPVTIKDIINSYGYEFSLTNMTSQSIRSKKLNRQIAHLKKSISQRGSSVRAVSSKMMTPLSALDDLFAVWATPALDQAVAASLTSSSSSGSMLGKSQTQPVFDPEVCFNLQPTDPIPPSCIENPDWKDDDYDEEKKDSDAKNPDYFSPLPLNKKDRNDASNIGIIIGVVVGAVVLFVIIIILVLWMKKNRRGCFVEKERRDRSKSATYSQSKTVSSNPNSDMELVSSSSSSPTQNRKSSGLPTKINDGEKLPTDWIKMKDPATDKIYYMNEKTLETSWVPPTQDGKRVDKSNDLGW